VDGGAGRGTGSGAEGGVGGAGGGGARGGGGGVEGGGVRGGECARPGGVGVGAGGDGGAEGGAGGSGGGEGKGEGEESEEERRGGAAPLVPFAESLCVRVEGSELQPDLERRGEAKQGEGVNRRTCRAEETEVDVAQRKR